MFDNRWDNWAGDFADSPAAMEFDSVIRDKLADILRHFGEAMVKVDPDFPDVASTGSFAKVLGEAMPRMDVGEVNRPHIPEVIARFFEYLGESGRLGEADEWASQIRELQPFYAERLKPNGGVRGVTIKKSDKVSPLGRNDPCPCGSGKKFKKCCMTYG